LGNAVKYTESGHVSFSVSGEAGNDDTILLTFKITDTGKGIRKEDIDKLFIEYVRVDTDAGKTIDGVGLGLTISNNLIRVMDGSIEVESELGTGSTFTVKLPQKVTSGERMAYINNPAEKKSLIYETRDVYAGSIAYTIGNLGGDFKVCSNDAELHGILAGEAFSFIFTSYELYVSNKEAIERLAADAKVILLTDFGEILPENTLNTLAMPVYSVAIANILNGGGENFSYSERSVDTVSFAAPGAKVLVVDDINTNLVVAKGLLLPYQLEIELCNSGADSIKALQSKDYDLVFMDHKMPGMDGIEATERIRAMEEQYYRELPIISLTANAVAGMREMYLEKGFNDYLSKPIDTIKLNEVLERWIPKAKQLAPMAAAEEASWTEEMGRQPIEIEGLDVRRGISISGGKLEPYFETLSTFYDDGMERSGEIKHCLASGDMTLLEVHVHALKSASGSIGADKLSKKAAVVEDLTVKGDFEKAAKRGADFVKDLDFLLASISKAVDKYAGKHGQNCSETFNSALIQLKDALDRMDAAAINQSADLMLGSSGAENSAFAKTVSGKILMAEYDEAAAMIGDILKEN
jgi:CheY-like chemotaxis protein/HPt (histidine-containing phosphotransfer) domain-containing protein